MGIVRFVVFAFISLLALPARSEGLLCQGLFSNPAVRPTSHLVRQQGVVYFFATVDLATLEAKLKEAKARGTGVSGLFAQRAQPHGLNHLWTATTGRLDKKIETAAGFYSLNIVMGRRLERQSPLLDATVPITASPTEMVLIAFDPSILDLGPWKAANKWTLRSPEPNTSYRPDWRSTDQDIEEFFEIELETQTHPTDYYAKPDVDAIILNSEIPLDAIVGLAVHSKNRRLHERAELVAKEVGLSVPVLRTLEFPKFKD